MIPNPFIYSRAIPPAKFSGRRAELNRIASRLATNQSVALIGQPHVGKTSLLQFFADPKARQDQFGDQFSNSFITFLDALALHGLPTQGDFWKYALAPLQDSKYAPQVTYAAQDGYRNFALEQIFAALEKDGSQLILLLDEFDSLLSHPVLNNSDFYGGLRTLVSRSGGFILVLAARHPLEQLNLLTQELNPHGSPYFNVFIEIQLGSIKSDALTAQLNLGGDHITDRDRIYVERVSGLHPYLAQATAAMLWDAHDEGLRGKERYHAAGQNLYRQTRQHFADTWRFWSNTTRKAVIAIALAQIPRLLSEHEFKVSELIEDLDDFSPELDILQVSGILTQNKTGEWIIAQDALLWWLADELRRNVRDEIPFSDWVRAQELDNLLTESEKQHMHQAAQTVLAIVGKGATTLIETLAKGFGESVFK